MNNKDKEINFLKQMRDHDDEILTDTIPCGGHWIWTHPIEKISGDVLINPDKYKKYLKEVKIKYDE